MSDFIHDQASGAVLPHTSRTPAGVELSVVVPSFNERSNVALLIARLEEALGDIDWEVIYVDDDSPDGTAEEVRAMSATNRRVRCVHRIGRRGLSSAVIEGTPPGSHASIGDHRY